MAAMRPKSHIPTLKLTRVQFFEDCTVGKLTDGKDLLLCMTLEPRWQEVGRSRVKGLSCITSGTYNLTFGYDMSLKYQCWKLTGYALPGCVRLCFIAKSGSVAAHSQGDILLGYLSPEGDEDRPFDGRLYRPVEAYERLLDYYVSLRANHGDFVLRVEPTKGPVTLLPAVEVPPIPPDLVRLEDYILQTL